MNDNNNLKMGFKLNIILFSALAIGQLLILLIFIFMVENANSEPNKELDNILLLIIPFFGFIMMFLARFVYNQNLLKVPSDDSVENKLNKYRLYKLISWAMLESAGLLCLIAFFLTSNYLYAAVFIFIFGFFLLSKPSKEGFVTDMQVTEPIKETILRT